MSKYSVIDHSKLHDKFSNHGDNPTRGRGFFPDTWSDRIYCFKFSDFAKYMKANSSKRKNTLA